MVIDPWGTVVAQGSDMECAFVCELDLEYLNKVREDMNCMAHMRRDLY